MSGAALKVLLDEDVPASWHDSYPGIDCGVFIARSKGDSE
jgi:hypothetical protein